MIRFDVWTDLHDYTEIFVTTAVVMLAQRLHCHDSSHVVKPS